jgi:5-methylcytosine-specific restriction endonuclease McrA
VSAPASHQHHVVPRSLGGVATVPLCHDCHGKAHSVSSVGVMVQRVGALP